MRRSRTIRLTLLAGSAVLLQACGTEDVDMVDVVVPDLAACVERFGPQSQADCQKTMADAQLAHAQSAPRFANLAACRETTGSACEEAPANRPSDKSLLASPATAIAIPVMAGVLVGRMLGSGSGRVTTPLYAGRPPRECPPGQQPPPPDCAPTSRTSASSSGRHYYSSGSYAGSTAGQRGAAAFTASPAMAATLASPRMGGPATVMRGGFGASARGFGSSG